MDSVNTYWADRSALEWQIELGADEAISDAPLNRYDLPDKTAKPAVADIAKTAAAPPAAPVAIDHAQQSKKLASAATSIDGLLASITAFDGSPLKRAARNTVFAQGNPDAPIMVIGEAPSRDEDRAGTPFAGDAAILLTNMFNAIDMGVEASSLYLASPLPWRAPASPPPANEVALGLPFLEHHIKLSGAKIIVVMGNTPCQMLLGKQGLTRLRGQWAEVLGLPAMPMLHPSSLLQNPAAKKDAWSDLRAIRAKLKELS